MSSSYMIGTIVRVRPWMYNASYIPHIQWYTMGYCGIGYPPQTHIKVKSRGISFVNNVHFNCPIVLKFCTEYGSITAVLCAKFQNDRTMEIEVVDILGEISRDLSFR